MAKKKIKIEWSKPASAHFQELLGHLHNESDIAASLVSTAILDAVGKLALHPTAYPPDRFKKLNDGNYRALVIYSYRISYYLDDHILYILRIRHSSREPLEH